MKKRLLELSILVAFAGSSASAATTSFDIQSGTNTESVFTAVTSFPASDGTVTMTVDFAPTGFRDRGTTVISGEPDEAILRDLAFWNGGGLVATFTFSGLQLNTEYSGLVWVFDSAQGNNNKSFNLTTAGGSGGGTISITNTLNTLAFAQNGPYSLVNFISTGTGTATIAMTNTAGNVSFINGFQLTAIPESSTALLGGLGMLALLRRRR